MGAHYRQQHGEPLYFHYNCPSLAPQARVSLKGAAKTCYRRGVLLCKVCVTPPKEFAQLSPLHLLFLQLAFCL